MSDAIPRSRVLIIEDDAAIAEVLAYNLEREGHEVLRTSDGRDGLSQVRLFQPELVILDLMLPGIHGIDICREIRSERSLRHLPILMLTAKSEESDQIIGFSVGADDYVTKPFSVKVLMQRVRVLLQRRQASPEPTEGTIEWHGIRMDRVAHQVMREDRPLPLTPTEYRLLETMIRQPGRAFTRHDLLRSAVGNDTIVLERTVDVHIRSLRQKLGDAAVAIETVRGIGYRFARDLTRNESVPSHP